MRRQLLTRVVDVTLPFSDWYAAIYFCKMHNIMTLYNIYVCHEEDYAYGKR